MPIYEYECHSCGHAFELERRIGDPPVRSCVKCRGRRVSRAIGRTTFVLKGGGWYADGYGRSTRAQSSRSEGGGAP